MHVTTLMNNRFYRPELDALRFAAFALVFINHGFPSLAGFQAARVPEWISTAVIGFKNGGAFGVDLFFLLSSYLITEILLREHRDRSAINVPAFWTRRILRIWPLYFGFLAFALWIVPLWLPQSFPRFHALAYATFWGNFAVIVRPGEMDSVGQLLWSVSIEEQFYFVWPLVISLFVGRLRSICFVLFLVSTATRLYLVATGVDSTWAFWSNTPARLEPIAAGALIAAILNGRMPELTGTRRVISIVSGLILIALAGTFGSFDGVTSLFTYPIATVAAVLLLLGTLGSPWPTPGWLTYLGRISYGLYVFHFFAISIVRKYIVVDHAFGEWALQFVAAFALTVACAALSYRYFERPFLRLKERFSHDAARTQFAAA